MTTKTELTRKLGFLPPFQVCKEVRYKEKGVKPFVIVDTQQQIFDYFDTSRDAHAEAIKLNNGIADRLKKLDKIENIPEAMYGCWACSEHHPPERMYACYDPQKKESTWVCGTCSERLGWETDGNSLDFFLSHQLLSRYL